MVKAIQTKMRINDNFAPPKGHLYFNQDYLINLHSYLLGRLLCGKYFQDPLLPIHLVTQYYFHSTLIGLEGF